MGKITVLDIVLRLLGAVIVGFAVGAQRARTSHPAGIRTHILVALGSCVVMVTSCILYEQTIAVFGTTPSDPARLGAQVINGIGFLGAGAILREGFTVRGLTTAASVWVVACLGLSVGMGYYVLTAVGTVIAFVTLVAFDGIQEKIRTRSRSELDLQIECDIWATSWWSCRIWQNGISQSCLICPSAELRITPTSSVSVQAFRRTDMSPRRMHSVRSWQVFPA